MMKQPNGVTMKYSTFHKEVETCVLPKTIEFKKLVGSEIRRLAIKPQKYEVVFNFEKLQTGLDWSIDIENLIKMFVKGEGKTDKAIGFYFLFHNTDIFFESAKKIDELLFGKGVTFAEKFPDFPGALPSSATNNSPRPIAKPRPRKGVNPVATQAVLKIYKLIMGDPDFLKFFYSLDYDTQPDPFEFDPEKFPRSGDEMNLDRLLYQIAIVGGILRRGEVEAQDIMWMQTTVKATLVNPHVQNYLKWVQTEDQVPGHSDFCDAIFLYERLVGDIEKLPVLQGYLAKSVKP